MRAFETQPERSRLATAPGALPGQDRRWFGTAPGASIRKRAPRIDFNRYWLLACTVGLLIWVLLIRGFVSLFWPLQPLF